MNFDTAVNNGNEGLYWLSEIKRLSPATPVVLFTAYADIAIAVRGMKENGGTLTLMSTSPATFAITLPRPQ